MTKMKDFAKSTAAKASAFGALAVARANYLVYCDAFTDASTAVTNLQSKLVTLAEALFPLAIVICGIAMFFTRDQKKFDVEKHILIGCCLAFALIVLVTKGHIVSTIKSLFNGGAGAPAAGV